MKTIVWDADDVLNDLMRCWFKEAWLCKHKACRLKYNDLTENPPHKLLGITEKQYLSSLDVFRNSDRASLMRPNRQILKWFREYGHLARHVVLTSRPLHTVPMLSEWVFKFFGSWVRTFSFVPTRADKAIKFYDSDKKEHLDWLSKADILIDDSMKNIKDAEQIGILGLLYPRPWNKSELTVEQLLSILTMQVKSKK